MVIRIISFFAGAIFGAVAALAVFHSIGDSRAQWSVGLAAVGMGLLAAILGPKFWEIALTIWTGR